MNFGIRIATHSILKGINKGCQENLVVSPLSFHCLLNLLASGSTGKTSEQMLRVLEAKSTTELNAQSSRLMKLSTSGRSGRGPIISLLNGIWVDHHYPLKHSFKQLAEDIYKAKVQSVDFLCKADQVLDEVNSWAREASKGFIDPFLPPDFLSKDSIAVLASALYFKGTWDKRFDASDTDTEDFHLLNGQTVSVPFMKRRNTCNYFGSFESFKILKMEYENDWEDWERRYAMYIFLPHKNDGLQELIQKFHSDPRFLTEDRKLECVELRDLWLPKLKFEYVLEAEEVMKELGLDLPFDREKAEITEMVEISDLEVVYISKAIQKSYIEVNEEGTVATSVTAFEMGGFVTSAMPVFSKIDFVADHPFLFMIKEEHSRTVLFVGAALNPVPEKNGAAEKRK